MLNFSLSILERNYKMVAEFNGVPYLILYIVMIAGFLMYTYQTLFTTVDWLAKYGIHESAVLPTRVLGSFVAAISLLGIYFLFVGLGGAWIFLIYIFVQACILVVAGYITVTSSNAATLDGVKYTAEGYIAPLCFAIVSAILIYGLSDKIYT